MKIKRTIEEIICMDEITLEDIQINGKKFSLSISAGERTHLYFKENNNDVGDYQIIIDKEGIRFERDVYRPKHDHDDTETLQIAVSDGPGRKKGEIRWNKRFPYRGEGWDFYYIPFGAVKVDY